MRRLPRTAPWTVEGESRFLTCFPYRHDDTIGPDLLVDDLSATSAYDGFHFLGHLRDAEEGVFLTNNHPVETCPHVFQAPSAIFTVGYVYADSFSHRYQDWSGVLRKLSCPLPAGERRVWLQENGGLPGLQRKPLISIDQKKNRIWPNKNRPVTLQGGNRFLHHLHRSGQTETSENDVGSWNFFLLRHKFSVDSPCFSSVSTG